MSRKTEQRIIRAVNGIGPGIGPSVKERLEQRNRKAAQMRKAQVRREEHTDWHTLAAREISDNGFIPHGRYWYGFAPHGRY